MKIPKERRQLCSDVTNSAEIELKKDLERRRQRAVERNMDRFFVWPLLFFGVLLTFYMLVDWWRSL